MNGSIDFGEEYDDFGEEELDDLADALGEDSDDLAERRRRRSGLQRAGCEGGSRSPLRVSIWACGAQTLRGVSARATPALNALVASAAMRAFELGDEET